MAAEIDPFDRRRRLTCSHPAVWVELDRRIR
jgi:hypothetical protein